MQATDDHCDAEGCTSLVHLSRTPSPPLLLSKFPSDAQRPQSSPILSTPTCAQLSKRPGVQKKVKLNVGGKKFCTTLETLLSKKSFFSSMFGGNFSLEPDEDGEYFLDRSYKHFDAVLSYLRTGVCILPNSDKALKEMLLECEYYQLDELVHMLEEKLGVVSKFMRPVTWSSSIHHRASTVQLSADGLTASGKGCVLTSEPVTRGRVYFEITLNDITGNCSRIGVVRHPPVLLDSMPEHGFLYCPACGLGYGKLFQRFKGNKLKESGDVFGMALDLDRRLLHFFKNGIFVGTSPTKLSRTSFVIVYLNEHCSEVTLAQKDYPAHLIPNYAFD